jgi:rhodanese-related sulfurtransferase
VDGPLVVVYTNPKLEKLIAGQDIQLLDVRTAEEYAEAHLQGSTNIDVLRDSFAQKAGEALKKGCTRSGIL